MATDARTGADGKLSERLDPIPDSGAGADQAASPRLTGLCALATLVGILGFLLLLSWRGRLLARAADAALLPGGAMLVCLALERGFPGRGQNRLRRAAAAALAALLLAAAIPHLQATLYALTRKPDTVSMQREADLETYALSHPDVLLVRSPNLLRDTRLRPNVSAGVPGNILIWGDWICHTPGWDRQLAVYGLRADAFSPADWLNAPLLLAAAEPAETDDLRDYLSDALGRPIQAMAVAREGSLQFYRFTAD
ncbi:MAG: hypothetical protein EOM10_18255 [Opitutae bacterium]|nr:hypothetical protein [Opitutae bacterium]